ncbi:MAG: hypothetical protein JWQ71_3220 [Pedosphaera sp.]|nr:hypothetical protein [Pedosphaera sp.]
MFCSGTFSTAKFKQDTALVYIRIEKGDSFKNYKKSFPSSAPLWID